MKSVTGPGHNPAWGRWGAGGGAEGGEGVWLGVQYTFRICVRNKIV